MMNFDDLDICDDIKSAIAEMGFKNMTPIQKMAIPEALSGKDVIGQAQTGTGKTVAFSIPILERIFIPDRSPQAIILCPTRELSIQVAEVISVQPESCQFRLQRKSQKLEKTLKSLRFWRFMVANPSENKPEY